MNRISDIVFVLIALHVGWISLFPGTDSCAADGYTRFKDINGRFTFDYPETMKIDIATPDEVRISHPKASLRITVIVENRPRKANPNVKALLDAFKKNLQEKMKEASILEEGTLQGLGGSQGYIICSFKDARGVSVVQLVQYYVTVDKLLQMIIADRPQGFINIEKVIRKIHRSLRVINPRLD